jgi:hypothetical protein
MPTYQESLDLRYQGYASRTHRSEIGGNLLVTYLDGSSDSYDLMADIEVMGNMTLIQGPGTFPTHFDNWETSLPVLVHGDLSISGTGTRAVQVGEIGGAGLAVGKKFPIDRRAANRERESAARELAVLGATARTALDNALTGTLSPEAQPE